MACRGIAGCDGAVTGSGGSGVRSYAVCAAGCCEATPLPLLMLLLMLPPPLGPGTSDERGNSGEGELLGFTDQADGVLSDCRAAVDCSIGSGVRAAWLGATTSGATDRVWAGSVGVLKLATGFIVYVR